MGKDEEYVERRWGLAPGAIALNIVLSFVGLIAIWGYHGNGETVLIISVCLNALYYWDYHREVTRAREWDRQSAAADMSAQNRDPQ